MAITRIVIRAVIGLKRILEMVIARSVNGKLQQGYTSVDQRLSFMGLRKFYAGMGWDRVF